MIKCMVIFIIVTVTWTRASIITDNDDKATPNPWRLCRVTKVEEVKMIIGLMPIWVTTIMFWTVYAQIGNFSVQQTSTMDRHLGKFRNPTMLVQCFVNWEAIMITLAIYNHIFMPLFKKSNRKQCIQFNHSVYGFSLIII